MTSTLLRSMSVVLMLAAVLNLPVGADTTEAHGGPLYLALGDSVAAGVGAGDPDEDGYVPQLRDRLLTGLECWPLDVLRCYGLRVYNLAEPGATTDDVLADQLPQATALLTGRNDDRRPFNDVQVVTLTIGGNDVFGPVVGACRDGVDENCAAAVESSLLRVATNLPVILRGLRSAAGPDTTIAVMTYYNPLGACELSGLAGLAEVVLEGGTAGENGPTVPLGLNDLIRRSAASAGAVVADTYGELGADDFVGGQDCLHPDDSGHAAVAAAFDAVIGRR